MSPDESELLSCGKFIAEINTENISKSVYPLVA